MQSSWGFSRYLVAGDLPEDYEEAFRESIQRYAFKNLDEGSAEERSVGWVAVHDMFQNRAEAMGFLKHPYIALSMRIDTKRVPAKALLRYTREAEAAVKAEEGLEYLPRARRLEIKDAVNLRLIKRAIPDSKLYDMVWNLDTGVVMFGSAGARLGDEFATLFSKTFGLMLTPLFPYSLGLHLLERKGKEPSAMDDMVPIELMEVEEDAGA
jgi:DNA recombination-dependent growth factor C